jgi:hypothetical protein
MRRIGSLIFDAFEGNSTTNGNPDVPTDGKYGETFIPEAPGNRWYFGDTWVNTLFARYYTNIFPNQAGKPATGFDFVMHNNAGGNIVTEVLIFTSGDSFDPNNPVAPTNFNQGVKLTYAGINPGSSIYSNVDLTAAPLTRPSGTSGWYMMEFASGDDANGNPIEATAAQPMMWGTKVNNPSQVSQYEWQDGVGDGTGRNGTLNTVFDWTFGYFGTATAYTVTRGVETSTHDVARLQGTPGLSVVVSQRPQLIPSFNNAEVTATVTLDPNTPASLRLLRAIVVVKANAVPLNAPSANMSISMLNRTTNTYDVVKSQQPVNSTGDGVLITCPSIPVANINNYIDPVAHTVSVRVGVRHGAPLTASWNLTVNKITVDASNVGPDPLAPSAAFSTNQ